MLPFPLFLNFAVTTVVVGNYLVVQHGHEWRKWISKCVNEQPFRWVFGRIITNMTMALAVLTIAIVELVQHRTWNGLLTLLAALHLLLDLILQMSTMLRWTGSGSERYDPVPNLPNLETKLVGSLLHVSVLDR